MVICTCKNCTSHHLVADNENKLDMRSESGYTRIDEYLKKKGENVKHLSVESSKLSDNYIVEIDGAVGLIPKQHYHESVIILILFNFIFYLISYFIRSR
jgi:hypothetical protein